MFLPTTQSLCKIDHFSPAALLQYWIAVKGQEAPCQASAGCSLPDMWRRAGRVRAYPGQRRIGIDDCLLGGIECRATGGAIQWRSAEELLTRKPFSRPSALAGRWRRSARDKQSTLRVMSLTRCL